jgi:hypothetical protein
VVDTMTGRTEPGTTGVAALGPALATRAVATGAAAAAVAAIRGAAGTEGGDCTHKPAVSRWRWSVLGAVVVRRERRRSRRPCHPRATSSGYERYAAVNHGHSEARAELAARP